MAFISTAEVKAIRLQLKAKFPDFKFSIRREHHSSVKVAIVKGDVDFSSELDSRGFTSINHYYPDRYNEEIGKLVTEIKKIIHKAPGTVEGGNEWYDNSDSMRDYFDTAFYFDINVGTRDKPYEYIKKAA